MTAMTKENATKMTAFWRAYWAADKENNTAVMNAAERMMVAARDRKPACEKDWATPQEASQRYDRERFQARLEQLEQWRQRQRPVAE